MARPRKTPAPIESAPEQQTPAPIESAPEQQTPAPIESADLVAVEKGGEVLMVHHTCVKAHTNAGWKVQE